jgi:hypothetical protein
LRDHGAIVSDKKFQTKARCVVLTASEAAVLGRVIHRPEWLIGFGLHKVIIRH